MVSKVGFVLSTGELLTIDVKVLPGQMDLEWAKGNLLYNFNSFFNDAEERNSFIENVLLWPYTDTLRRLRISIVQTLPQEVQKRWKGNSFQLACVIAFARGQGTSHKEFGLNEWPSVIATGKVQRYSDDLFVVPVGNNRDFNNKLEGVSAASPKPDLWIYPKKQKLDSEQKALNRLISKRGIAIQSVDTVKALYESDVCPPPGSLNTRSGNSRRALIPFALLVLAMVSLSPLIRDMSVDNGSGFTAEYPDFAPLGEYEVMIKMVSKSQYKKYLDATGLPYPPGYDLNEDEPASYVSWDSAESYCNSLERDPGIKSAALPGYDELEHIYQTETFVKPDAQWHEWSADSGCNETTDHCGTQRLVKGAAMEAWNPNDDQAQKLGFRCKVLRN